MAAGPAWSRSSLPQQSRPKHLCAARVNKLLPTTALAWSVDLSAITNHLTTLRLHFTSTLRSLHTPRVARSSGSPSLLSCSFCFACQRVLDHGGEVLAVETARALLFLLTSRACPTNQLSASPPLPLPHTTDGSFALTAPIPHDAWQQYPYCILWQTLPRP